jgi:hypothetical protein
MSESKEIFSSCFKWDKEGTISLLFQLTSYRLSTWYRWQFLFFIFTIIAHSSFLLFTAKSNSILIFLVKYYKEVLVFIGQAPSSSHDFFFWATLWLHICTHLPTAKSASLAVCLQTVRSSAHLFLTLRPVAGNWGSRVRPPRPLIRPWWSAVHQGSNLLVS